MTNPISSSRLNNISVRHTEARATPPTTGQRFRETLSQGANALLSGVESLAGVVPGGRALVAATSGQAGSATGSAASATGTGTATDPNASSSSLLNESADQTMQLIALQQQINMENRQYSTVSNVLKARHDTAKNVIGNVRG